MIYYALGKSNLLDSEGNVTGITVAAAISGAGQGIVDSWNGTYDPYDESAECTSHPALMNDLLIARNDPATVNISGLVPGGSYDLCLYGHSRNTQGNCDFNVGGSEQSTSFATVPHTLTAGIDYVVYNDVLADSMGKISFNFIDNTAGYTGHEGGLNGFQIRGEAYTGPPIEEPAVSDINILSGASAAGSSTENDWYPQTATDGNAVVTDGVNSDWVAPNGDANPRLAVWGFNSGFNKIRIWGAGDLDPNEVEIKSSTSLITPTDSAFAEDLTDSYETLLLEMTTPAEMVATRITDGMYGDLPWQMYYWEYTVNAPEGTQSLFFDFGESGRTRICEVQAMTLPVLPGDANEDGVVNDDDAVILAANWLKQGGATWRHGDFNGDGNVDDIDAAMLASNWQVGSSSVSVPEPSVLMLLCSAIAVFWIKRR